MNTNQTNKLPRFSTLPPKRTSEIGKEGSMMKKSSTFPVQESLKMEMLMMTQQNCQSNPFLKARMRAYMKDLDHTTTEIKIKREDSNNDTQGPLYEEERVTFKKLNQSVKTSNKGTVNEIAKKIEGSKKQLQKIKESV